MYRLSPLPRKVLITTDEVIKMSSIADNPEIKQLVSAIVIAEERFVKPIIGKGIYSAFRDQKNVIVTSVNKSYLEGLINEGQNVQLTLRPGDFVNSLDLVTNTYFVALWNEHLWKICAEAVVYVASPTNYSRFTSAGEMENNPKVISNEGQGAASVDLSKMKWKMDKMLMDRIDPLISSLQDWLVDNKHGFNGYSCPAFDLYTNTRGTTTTRKTAWINPYIDIKKTCCK